MSVVGGRWRGVSGGLATVETGLESQRGDRMPIVIQQHEVLFRPSDHIAGDGDDGAGSGMRIMLLIGVEIDLVGRGHGLGLGETYPVATKDSIVASGVGTVVVDEKSDLVRVGEIGSTR
jgi:hypothetical protein